MSQPRLPYTIGDASRALTAMGCRVARHRKKAAVGDMSCIDSVLHRALGSLVQARDALTVHCGAEYRALIAEIDCLLTIPK